MCLIRRGGEIFNATIGQRFSDEKANAPQYYN
jgi:hypothetical protein